MAKIVTKTYQTFKTNIYTCSFFNISRYNDLIWFLFGDYLNTTDTQIFVSFKDLSASSSEKEELEGKNVAN